ncbi:uncharacterized protein LAESUDRAFT_603249, partial [Laetiporus sulphureus 93-53]
LNGSNYAQWVMYMEAELTRKGLWEVVEFEYKGERDPENMWDQLKAVHMSRGLATEVTRWRALLNAGMTAEESVEGWIGRVRGLARGLEAIGEEVPKKLQAIIAVVGLREELNMVETKLDAVDRKLWTVEQVAALALNEEAR